jgi:hypothetical protein
MPQLKIKVNDLTIERIDIGSLKKAVAYVQTIEETNRNSKYVFSTVNETTRIENTVVIKKNN